MLTAAAGLSTLLFVLVGAAVGLRLTALAWRTRETAESLLGPSLFVLVGVGYPLLMVGRFISEQGGETGPMTMVCGLASMSVGWSLMGVFTWRVFRPVAGWAGAAVGVSCLVFVGCLVGSVMRALAIGHPQDAVMPTAPEIVLQMNAMALYLWTAAESLHYHTLLRKRLALGLVSPVVANRFLLFGVLMVFAATSTAAPLFGSVMGIDPMGDARILLVVAASGSTATVALFLAFLPPKAYVARLEARARPIA
ncbi:MAG: hypothetical protein JRH01_13365 [Deltaproteobacteria bacterium]|nr:hypothetical protein [Deltaproteobacteria bacterium]MBW2393715.1 hypothetical protein [Deltaproteobacteria bacterium]